VLPIRWPAVYLAHMKHLLLVLAVAVAAGSEAPSGTQIYTANSVNGRCWMTMDETFKIGYLLAISDALTLVRAHDLKLGTELSDNYIPGKIAMGEVIAGINAVYAEGPEMARIPVVGALALFQLKVIGASPESYADRKSTILKSVALLPSR